MIWLRSALFTLLQVVITPLFSVLALLTYPVPPQGRYRIIRQWANLFMWLAKVILGIRYRVLGAERIPEVPSIVLAKHQSAWETWRFSGSFRRRSGCSRRNCCASPIACLRAPDADRAPVATCPVARSGVAFLFPGGGAQYRNMGRELYATEPVFREHMDRCAAILAQRRGLALHRALYESGDGEGLTEPAAALPALFAVEYSLAQVWIWLGIEPAAMLGHSMGEYVAACLAGVFSLEDALALVSERARLFETLPAGGMLSVAQPEAELAPLLGSGVAIAAINAPDQCAVAGHASAIAALAEELNRRQIEYRRIPIDVAAHSPVADPSCGTRSATTPMRRRCWRRRHARCAA